MRQSRIAQGEDEEALVALTRRKSAVRGDALEYGQRYVGERVLEAPHRVRKSRYDANLSR
jgi:hypothetical protein